MLSENLKEKYFCIGSAPGLGSGYVVMLTNG